MKSIASSSNIMSDYYKNFEDERRRGDLTFKLSCLILVYILFDIKSNPVALSILVVIASIIIFSWFQECRLSIGNDDQEIELPACQPSPPQRAYFSALKADCLPPHLLLASILPDLVLSNPHRLTDFKRNAENDSYYRKECGLGTYGSFDGIAAFLGLQDTGGYLNFFPHQLRFPIFHHDSHSFW